MLYFVFFFLGLHGCIRQFKLGHKEVKIQSASEPFALRRVSITECDELSPGQLSPCSHLPCLNGGTCFAAVTTPNKYQMPSSTSLTSPNDVPTAASPYMCSCRPGFAGDRCQELQTTVAKVDLNGNF